MSSLWSTIRATWFYTYLLMSNVRFIGCLHLGHGWMAQHRDFPDSYHHDEYLIKAWNSVVSKQDTTYVLGDVTMETDEHYYQLDRLNGRKIVVLGNHDLPKHVPKLLKYVDSVAGMIDYKGFCLTHAPIHPDEMGFYKGNIHAHIHHKNVLTEHLASDRYQDEEAIIQPTLYKYKNVDAKLINFLPKTLDQL